MSTIRNNVSQSFGDQIACISRKAGVASWSYLSAAAGDDLSELLPMISRHHKCFSGKLIVTFSLTLQHFYRLF